MSISPGKKNTKMTSNYRILRKSSCKSSHNSSCISWGKNRRKEKPGGKFPKEGDKFPGHSTEANKKSPPEVAGSKRSDSGVPSAKIGITKSKDLYTTMVDAINGGLASRNPKKPKQEGPNGTGTYSPEEYKKRKESNVDEFHAAKSSWHVRA